MIINYMFISNANNRIKLYNNPVFNLIKNNLCLTLTQEKKHQKQIIVYSEDEVTRWFFKKLIYGYANKIKFININLGCNELEIFLKQDPHYFSTVLFVVDGDVKERMKSFVKKKNVIALVGNTSPEKLFYDYLDSDKCIFWENVSEDSGMTKQYLLVEKGIKSDDYKDKEEGEKYKSWFFDQKENIEKYKMLESWKEDNIDKVTEFKKEFISKYNDLANINQIDNIK